MDTEQTLRQIVAELMQTDASQLRAETRLAGGKLNGSLGRAILDSAIRRKLGVANVNVQNVKTFGELQAAVMGTAVSSSMTVDPSPAPQRSDSSFLSAPAGVSCGIDMEMVDALPTENDYWQGEFYRSHFTRAEIAYCLTKPEPRPHFAARWCAKEALKKCDPAYLAAEFASIEVVIDPAGKPSLRAHVNGDWTPLPHAVSLTHTPVMAAAVVVGGASVTTTTAPVNHNGSTAPAAPSRGLLAKLLGR